MDAGGRLIVRAPSGTILGGPAPDGVVLEQRFDQVLLVSIGTNWVIFDSNALGGGARNRQSLKSTKSQSAKSTKSGKGLRGRRR